MKAAIVPGPGRPPEFGEFPDPNPAAGRRIVQLVAAGIHPLVRSLVSGRHYASAHRGPAVPGVDCVARTDTGDLVYTGYTEAPYGTLAELVSVPTDFAVPVPAGADPLLVAAGVNPGMSSWLPLQHLAGDAAGRTVLITGSTGAAGRLAVQNARLLGAARVIALGRDPAGLESVAGASETVALTGQVGADAEALRAVFAGGVPDLVLDYLWGPVAETVLTALTGVGLQEQRTRTRYVQIGAMAGPAAAIPANALRSRPIEIVGSGAGSVSVATIMELLPRYLDILATGQVQLDVRGVPLAQVAEAWAAGASGTRTVVLA